MPDMDGIVLAMCLRDSHPGLPVVAVTAATEESDLTACRQAGVVDVLRKPLSVGALDHAIRRHVDQARHVAGAGSARAAAGMPLSVERLEMLARESARLLGRMRDDVEARLFDAVHADAHAMKGALAMIGEYAVVQMCEAIEQLARNGESAAILAQVSRLGEGLDEMLGARRRAGVAIDHRA